MRFWIISFMLKIRNINELQQLQHAGLLAEVVRGAPEGEGGLVHHLICLISPKLPLTTFTYYYPGKGHQYF